MNILLTGLSHHTAPLDVRERLIFDAGSLPLAIRRLREMTPQAKEWLLLSTCNRTEILIRGRDTPMLRDALTRFFLEKSGLDGLRLQKALFWHRDLHAIRHFFRVAASLDSMVLGEPQILGQVKNAQSCALEEGALHGILDTVCRRAFHSAKRVRTETSIGRNPVSISYAAAELARTIFGDLHGTAVLVLGAGEMSELTLRHLKTAGTSRIQVATRRLNHAAEVARRVGGEAIAFDRLGEALERVDIVISSTAAPHILVHAGDVESLIRRRRNRPIFFVDIAVPRDIDPGVNEIDNVYLYDIDDLQRIVNENIQERRADAQSAEDIIDSEVAAFHRWYLGLKAEPTITAMRATLHAIKDEELGRFNSRFPDLDPEHRAGVEQFARTLINKVLHRPTVELKRSLQGGSTPGQVELVRRLFGLDQEEAAPSAPGKPGRLHPVGNPPSSGPDPEQEAAAPRLTGRRRDA